MRLNKKQTELLAAVEFRAKSSAKELSRLLKVREYTLNYQLRRLKDLKLIDRPRPVIDMHRLGFTHYFVYVSIVSPKPSTKQALLDYLEVSPKVTWIFEVGAQFQLAFTVSARNIGELDEFIMSLVRKFPEVLSNHAICTQVGFEYLGRRYLSRASLVRPPLEFTVSAHNHSISRDDERILSAMAGAEVTTIREIADLVSIPSATVERHIQRLERDKVILGYFYWIDAEVFGRSSFTITIKLARLNPTFVTGLREWARQWPEVIILVRTIGPWDFELVVEVAGHGAASQITQSLYSKFGESVANLQVIPILRTHKIRSYPPVWANS